MNMNKTQIPDPDADPEARKKEVKLSATYRFHWTLVKISFANLWHFGTDSDADPHSRIRTSY
jgi:hypothetical protein